MRVNILTQPLFCNYGGILQNYALQTVLKELGCAPLTVNVPPVYPSKPALWKNALKTIRNGIMKVFGNYYTPFINPYTFAKKEHELSFPQRDFIKKHIIKVDIEGPFEPKITEAYPSEAWIVGSDQVWRPWCAPFILNNFFDFIEEDSDIKRIAYAASFGTDKWEISEFHTEQIKQLINKFNGISVRELSGVDLCKKYLDADAKCVLDPTLLLTSEQYLSLTSPGDTPKGDYIATYVLDINKDKEKAIKNQSREKQLSVVKLGQMHRNRFDSIESWIAGIANAKYVITDSFHGTVFSLIFGKPVRILSNNVRGNSRLESLFTLLKLSIDDEGFVHLVEKSLLEKLRKESISFIKDALKFNFKDI